MSTFTWKAAFSATCPMCGEHMPANTVHQCHPQPLDKPQPTLGAALAAYLAERAAKERQP